MSSQSAAIPDTGGRGAKMPRSRYKRPFDLALLAIAGIPLLPLWLLVAGAAALGVRIGDGCPVLYRQARLGRHGRVFTLLKFRTMKVDAEARTGPVWAAPRDPRITCAGRVLRRFHVDELPQVVNVLRGEMSLVGPRPERPELAERFECAVPGFSDRLQAPPGIAGLAQACCKKPVTPRRKLRYDRVYIQAMGPWLDLKVCVLCVLRVLRGRPWRARGPGAQPSRVRRRQALGGASRRTGVTS